MSYTYDGCIEDEEIDNLLWYIEYTADVTAVDDSFDHEFGTEHITGLETGDIDVHTVQSYDCTTEIVTDHSYSTLPLELRQSIDRAVELDLQDRAYEIERTIAERAAEAAAEREYDRLQEDDSWSLYY